MPVDDKDSIYQMIVREMQNSVEELYCESGQWLNVEYTTSGNPNNTFTGGKQEPKMLDYIFHRANSLQKVRAWTSAFSLPLLKIPKPRYSYDNEDDVELMSISDHEAIEAEITMCAF